VTLASLDGSLACYTSPFRTSEPETPEVYHNIWPATTGSESSPSIGWMARG